MEDIYKEMIKDLHWLMFWSFAVGVFISILASWLFSPTSKKKKKKKKKKKNKCDCKDINEFEKEILQRV